MSHDNAKPMITDVFVQGARQGWNIGVTSTIPNVMMAFVLIKILKHSGLLTIIGDACAPAMGVFGLPGEAITVLLAAWMSMGGGVGVAMALYQDSTLSGVDLGVIIPAIYLMGSQLQYMGRCLGVIGIKGRDIPLVMAVPILMAILSLFVMRAIITFTMGG